MAECLGTLGYLFGCSGDISYYLYFRLVVTCLLHPSSLSLALYSQPSNHREYFFLTWTPPLPFGSVFPGTLKESTVRVQSRFRLESLTRGCKCLMHRRMSVSEGGFRTISQWPDTLERPRAPTVGHADRRQ